MYNMATSWQILVNSLQFTFFYKLFILYMQDVKLFYTLLLLLLWFYLGISIWLIVRNKDSI